VAEWLVHLTAVWEDPGSNNGCIYRDNSYDLQPWRGLYTFTAVPRLTQPSTLRGMVKWISAYGMSNNNNGDGGCGW